MHEHCNQESDVSSAPVLDGIHHLKLPVTDLDRSLAWYQDHLGYEVMTEFVEEGVRMGVALLDQVMPDVAQHISAARSIGR